MFIDHCIPPQIIGSFSQTFCFPRAVAYLDSKKINVKGMVNTSDLFAVVCLHRAIHVPGDRRVQARGLSACFRQNEQPKRSKDRDKTLNTTQP